MNPSYRCCTHCGGEVRADYRVCSHCGAKIERSPEERTPEDASGKRSAWSKLAGRLQAATGDRYRIEDLLGYGGMAGVFLGDDRRLDRKVAIKVMSPSLMMDSRLVQRFQQEARTIAKLDHPNIVTIYEVGRGEGLHYFTMSYVPGRSLGQVMAEQEEALEIPVVKVVLSQIAEALAYAHRTGVVHRDVKPGNILIDEDGTVVVTDFGIARMADTPGLTRTGMLVGTPSYMSPEQCAGASVTGASDQYSLGAVAFQMLTSRPLFEGGTAAVLHAHLHTPAPSVREWRRGCPPRLATTIEKMLSKDPEDRWPDLQAVSSALDAPALRLDDPVRVRIRDLAAPVGQISVEPAAMELEPGRRGSAEAVVLSRDGRQLSNRRVRWSSSDTSVAVVTADGVVGAVGPGQAVVRGSAGEASASLDVQVGTGARIEKLEISESGVVLAPGQRLRLDAFALLDDGTALKDCAVEWSSMDPEVAAVASDGTVRALESGLARIRARLGTTTAGVRVRVSAAASPPGAPDEQVASSRSWARIKGKIRGKKRAVLVGGVSMLLLASALTLWRSFAGPTGTGVDGGEQVTAPGLGDPAAAAIESDEAAVAGSVSSEVMPSGDDSASETLTAVRESTGAGPDAATTGLDEPEPEGGVEAEATGLPDRASDEFSSAERVGEGVSDAPRPNHAPAVADSPAARDEPLSSPGAVRVAGPIPFGAEVMAQPVDGGRMRPIADSSIALPPGEYELRLRGPDGRLYTERVRVRAGETVRWTPLMENAGAADEVSSSRGEALEVVGAFVEDFVRAFGARRVSEVVPLLPAGSREGWRSLLESSDVQDFTVSLASVEEPRVDLRSGRGSADFNLDLSYRNLNRVVEQELALTAGLERRDGIWTVRAVAIRP